MIRSNGIFGGAIAFLLTAIPAAAQDDDWVRFDDVSAMNIVATTGFGIDDTEEKDLAVGDLNGDGWPDLVVVRKRPFSLPGGRANALFINNQGIMVESSATLAPAFADATDDRDVVLADLNGDGWLDVTTAPTFGDAPRVYINRGKTQQGDWLGLEFDPQAGRLPGFVPAPKFCAVAAGDVTGNGSPDLYFADYENSLEDRLLINDGSGFFADETGVRLAPGMAESVFGTSALILDLNGDGWNDIVKVNSSGNNAPPGSSPSAVRVFTNDGNGQFNQLDLVYTAQPYMVISGDFNNDQRPDLFVVDDGQDAVLLNQSSAGGPPVFTITSVGNSPDTAGFGGNLAVADLDDDGFLDIVVSDVDTDIPGCDRSLAVLRNNGSGHFTDPLANLDRPWKTAGTFDAAIADFNRDGAPDLWAGTCSGHRLFFGRLTSLLFADSFEEPPTAPERSGHQRRGG